MRGWRVALRIARRDALRHRARSALIVLMVGLPVLGLTVADVVVRTLQLSPEQSATRQLGTADALVQTKDDGVTAAGVERLLGPGSTAVTIRNGAVVYGSPAGVTQQAVVETDPTAPLSAGIYQLRAGRYATRPGEVTIDPGLAHQLGLRVGSRWTLIEPARSVTVVGMARQVSGPGALLVLAPPGTLLAGLSSGGSSYRAYAATPSYLVRSNVPQSRLADLSGLGYVETRDSLLHPPATPLARDARVQVGVVAIGLGVLQVVLLAGTGFAVGARRQVRDLALVAAAGGEQRQVGAVVLAGGFLAGLLGGVGGVALGIPLARVVLPRLASWDRVVPGPFDLRPTELAVGALVGVVAGLLAALTPARTAARQDVVLALGGRRGVRGTPRALTRGGAAAVVLGAVVTARGAAAPVDTSLLLTGSVLVELGFVAMTPAFVGLVARGAGLLPVAGRMALRDAARHRVRSGPAVAAVLAAVAGLVAISTYLVSSSAYERSTYQGLVRPGQASLTGVDEQPVDAATARAVAAALPTRAVVVQTAATVPCTLPADPVGENAQAVCPPLTATPTSASDGAPLVAFGDASLLRTILGRDDPAAEAALAAGHAVAVTPTALRAGAVDLSYDGTDGMLHRVATLPAVYADPHLRLLPSSFPGVVVPASFAARWKVHAYQAQVIVDTTRTPTRAEEARANALLRSTSAADDLVVERGYQSRTNAIQLALAAVAAVITVGAIAIATGLAAAEGRADLATLAAVGASPGLRRRLAMAQAAVVAVIGGVLGVAAGLVPAIAVVHARAGWPLELPWPAIVLAVTAVPLLAALLAGLVTRSRLPLVARLG